MTQINPGARLAGSRSPTRPAMRRSGPDGTARWVAIAPGNAKRTAFMVLAMIVGLWVAVWAFDSMSNFLFILLLAWLLSIAMEPPVLWLSRHGVKRGVASGIVLLGMIVLAIGVGAMFGQVFLAQFAQLGEALPGAMSSVVTWVNSTFKTGIDPASVGNFEVSPEQLGNLAQQYGGGLLGVFGSLLTFVFDLLTILVFAYYLSADSPTLRQTIGGWLPPRYQPVLITVWTIAVEKTGGYVVSKVVLATLSAVAHAAFFWFINVPFWLPLGVLAGIVGQFIPTIGTYIGVALPALFAFLDKPINVVWIVVFATVYQQIENYWLTPKVSRRTMDVHPAVALGSVIAGAALFGPIGALIGIPVAAALLTIATTFTRRHELLPELAALQDPSDDSPSAASEVAAEDEEEQADREALSRAAREVEEVRSAD